MPPEARSAAHPRSRGENPRAFSAFATSSGSSPLTRGKPGLLAGQGHLSRLIPAHAGKTSPVGQTTDTRRAHPRSRGENPLSWSFLGGLPGSSPLTRGKLASASFACATFGLIPAHAGKTLAAFASAGLLGAHPRSRGENTATLIRADDKTGSSPLTRGKPPANERPRGRRGLIPAHAGKTHPS